MGNKKTSVVKSGEALLPTSAVDFEIDLAVVPDDLDGVTDLVQGMMIESRRTSVIYAWNIGKLCQHVHDTEGKYGSRAVETMAEKLGKSGKILWEMKRFFNAYSDYSKVKDFQLEWSSARELLRLEDGSERKKVETRTIKENLSVRDVRGIVTDLKKGKQKPPKSQPKKPPAPNALKFFMKLEGDLTAINNQLDSLIKDILPMLSLVSDENRTSDEEYKILVEGTEKEQPLVKKTGRLAVSITEKLARNVVTLETVFDESSSESP